MGVKMSYFKFLLLFAVFFLIPPSCSFKIINPPVFYDNDFRKIEILQSYKVDNAEVQSFGSTNYIIYNPFYLQNYPPDVQLFIFWHEFYHIKFNHISREYSKIEQLQKESDCFALLEIDTFNVRLYIKKIRKIDNVDVYCSF